MMTPEGVTKKEIKKLLKEYGCYQFWCVVNGMGAPSLDCVGCYRGKYFAVEAKALGKKPTPRQEVTMKAMRDAGAFVIAVDGSDLSMAMLSGWLEAVKCL